MRLLVVEDEPDLRRTLARALADEHFAVDTSGDGDDGLFRALHVDYDAIVLDLMLPGGRARKCWSGLRQAGQTTPVIVLTAKDLGSDRVANLNRGADDYLTKPFLLEELVARIHALIRRAARQPSPAVTVGDLRINLAARRVYKNGEEIELTGREYSILELLVTAPRRRRCAHDPQRAPVQRRQRAHVERDRRARRVAPPQAWRRADSDATRPRLSDRWLNPFGPGCSSGTRRSSRPSSRSSAARCAIWSGGQGWPTWTRRSRRARRRSPKRCSPAGRGTFDFTLAPADSAERHDLPHPLDAATARRSTGPRTARPCLAHRRRARGRGTDGGSWPVHSPSGRRRPRRPAPRRSRGEKSGRSAALLLAAGGAVLACRSSPAGCSRDGRSSPITRISGTARRMMQGDLSARIPVERVETELGQVARRTERRVRPPAGVAGSTAPTDGRRLARAPNAAGDGLGRSAVGARPRASSRRVPRVAGRVPARGRPHAGYRRAPADARSGRNADQS